MIHYESFEYITQSYKNLIWNTANDVELCKKIAPFGYTHKELERGKSLYLLLMETVDKQKEIDKLQFIATNRYNASRNTIESSHDLIHEQCKFILMDNPYLWNYLHLSESVPHDYYDWHPYVLKFYTKILSLPHVIEDLKPFGHSISSIQEVVSLLATIDNIQTIRKKEGTEKLQRLAMKRDVFFQELKIYCVRLKKLLQLINKDLTDIDLVKEKVYL